jgi:hypothetical protein
MGLATRLGRFFLADELDLVGSERVEVNPFFKKSVALATPKSVMFETVPRPRIDCEPKGNIGVPSGFFKSKIFPR